MNKRSLFAGPYIIWIIGFTVLPILTIVFYALRDESGGFTAENILAIFQPVHMKALLLALWLALICTVICLLLAYPLAVILRKLNIGKQGMMAIIVILPMWVNFVLRIMAWQLLLSRNGLINGALGALGLPAQDLANSSVAIVIGMVYDYLPFMILPVYNAVAELKEDVLEAARDLGAPPKAVLTRIMIPLTKPGIISGIMMVFVPALTLVGCALCGLSVAIMWPGTLSDGAKRFPMAGTALFGLYAICGDIGCSVGPWLTGLVSDLTQKNESLLAWGQSVGWSAETLGLRVGLLSATVFPLLLLICTLILARKPKENR